MKIEMVSASSMSMLFMTFWANPAAAHACGIDHVRTKQLGLEVYFEPDASFIFFTVNRTGPLGPSSDHSVRKGRLVPPDNPSRHGFHLFAPRHFFLDRRGAASSFNLFGGCSYEVQWDAREIYLHVQGADGDTSDAVYDEDIRPDQ